MDHQSVYQPVIPLVGVGQEAVVAGRLTVLARRRRALQVLAGLGIGDDDPGGDREAAQAAYQKVVPVLDSAANHGLISVNKAARHKSRLNAQIKAL